MSSRSWCCCNPLCCVSGSAVSTPPTTNVHRQEEGRGTQQSTRSSLSLEEEGGPPSRLVADHSKPFVDLDSGSLGFLEHRSPQRGSRWTRHSRPEHHHSLDEDFKS